MPRVYGSTNRVARYEMQLWNCFLFGLLLLEVCWAEQRHFREASDELIATQLLINKNLPTSIMQSPSARHALSVSLLLNAKGESVRLAKPQTLLAHYFFFLLNCELHKSEISSARSSMCMWLSDENSLITKVGDSRRPEGKRNARIIRRYQKRSSDSVCVQCWRNMEKKESSASLLARAFVCMSGSVYIFTATNLKKHFRSTQISCASIAEP